MTDKVLGFYEKDAKRLMEHETYPYFAVREVKLVPVRLKSKSVSLKALEDWLKDYCNPSPFEEGSFFPVDDLLLWAKKEAGKK